MPVLPDPNDPTGLPPREGDRLLYLGTSDPYGNTIPIGSWGIIHWIDAIGTLHVDWDDGSTIGIIPHLDWFIIPLEGRREYHGRST
jgi:hypothetical protein